MTISAVTSSTVLRGLDWISDLASAETVLTPRQQLIARAIVNRPAIILADEPTSALDDANCDKVARLLEEQASAVGATLLVVTHDSRLKEKFPNQMKLS